MIFFVRTLRTLGCATLLLIIPGLVGSAKAAADIAVTLPPLAGLVAMLDKQAEILCLLSNGSDPHHFQLTAKKIEAAQQTKLLIRASRDDAGWPLPPQHGHTLDLWPETDHGWLNPITVRTVLPLIAKALIDLHPEREAAIAIALQEALHKTDSIERAWQQALAPAKKAGVLMQHPAWLRLLQAMQVPVLEVLESGRHGHEHGPRQLEHALATLHAQPDAWIIADRAHNNRALDWLQSHAKHQPRRISLDALGTCSQSWPELMHFNLHQFGVDQAKPDQSKQDKHSEKGPA